jgi:hypothetical protein
MGGLSCAPIGPKDAKTAKPVQFVAKRVFGDIIPFGQRKPMPDANLITGVPMTEFASL